MTGVRRAAIAEMALGVMTACGGGTGPWVHYLEDQGVLDPNLAGYDEARYEMTRTGFEMCRLMRDDDFTVPMIVLAYSGHDPQLVETLAVGADAHLCDNVDYHEELEPWEE